jgi:hypothetical protein
MGIAADAAPAGGCGSVWNPLRLPHGETGHLCETGPDGVTNSVAEGCRDLLAALHRADAETAATLTHTLISQALPQLAGEAYRAVLLVCAAVLDRTYGTVSVEVVQNAVRSLDSGVSPSPFQVIDTEVAGLVCAVADRDEWSTIGDILRQLRTDKHRVVVFVRLSQITTALLGGLPQ